MLKKSCVLFSLLTALLLLFSGCTNNKADISPTTLPSKAPFIKNDHNPVVYVDYYGLCLLGGYYNNQWISVDKIEFNGLSKARKSYKKISNVDIGVFKGNETFHFYSDEKLIKQASADQKPYFYTSPASTQDFYISPTKTGLSYKKLTVGINGEWNGIPREVKRVGNSYEFDPNGDGNTAKLFFDQRAKYKIDLRLEYLSQLFTVQTLSFSEIPDISDCVLVLDSNGDGKFEMIVQERSTSGGIFLYTIHNNKITRQLGLDLGD